MVVANFKLKTTLEIIKLPSSFDSEKFVSRTSSDGGATVASSRSVIIAGAGIGGLTAALALAQRGFPVAVFDQAQRLEEAGAGLQLSPNASRILLALGLGPRLQPQVVVPEELRVRDARTARVLARAPFGATAASATTLWSSIAALERAAGCVRGIPISRCARHRVELARTARASRSPPALRARSSNAASP
jgi:cation diffusion facilitator CzcD-associated flavoprotein CzcO